MQQAAGAGVYGVAWRNTASESWIKTVHCASIPLGNAADNSVAEGIAMLYAYLAVLELVHRRIGTESLGFVL